MDFLLLFAFVRAIPTQTGLLMLIYTTCSILQSLLTIWMYISYSYDMSYVITYGKSELWAHISDKNDQWDKEKCVIGLVS